MRTQCKYLFDTAPPWLYVGTGESERERWLTSYYYSNEELAVCAKHLRGDRMKTVSALMDEFASTLQFPLSFGSNWLALEEFLEYMDEWIPAKAYVLVIENANQMLAHAEDIAIDAFIITMHAAGKWWSRPIENNDRYNRMAVPFHVLLLTEDRTFTNHILTAAKRLCIPVRTD